MRLPNKLLLLFLALAMLGTTMPALAGGNLDSPPPTVDWRFCGPKIRPGVTADCVWGLLMMVVQKSALTRAWVFSGL